jgi:hypothetical protein
MGATVTDTRKDGGPAFPGRIALPKSFSRDGVPTEFFDFAPGMSLRDYFAGQALAGWIAASPGSILGNVPEDTTHHVARQCLKFADAMIAERSK